MSGWNEGAKRTQNAVAMAPRSETEIATDRKTVGKRLDQRRVARVKPGGIGHCEVQRLVATKNALAVKFAFGSVPGCHKPMVLARSIGDGVQMAKHAVSAVIVPRCAPS